MRLWGLDAFRHKSLHHRCGRIEKQLLTFYVVVKQYVHTNGLVKGNYGHDLSTLVRLLHSSCDEPAGRPSFDPQTIS